MEVQRSRSRPHGKFVLTVERAKVNDVMYACSVHMYQCINEL